jgi:hypothetical protein
VAVASVPDHHSHTGFGVAPLGKRSTSALTFLAAHARDRCAATGTATVEVDLVDGMYAHPYALPRPTLRPGQPAPRETSP